MSECFVFQLICFHLNCDYLKKKLKNEIEYMPELSMNYFNFQYSEIYTCCVVFIKEI